MATGKSKRNCSLFFDHQKGENHMANGYPRPELLKKFLQSSKSMSTFYQQDFINYRGKTTDTNELYTEVVAEWCIENLSRFEEISKITRASSYKTASHDGVPDNNCSNRTEELIAMSMFRQRTFPLVGQVIDYQTPLKSKRSDHAGKIDLLAYDGNVLRILELKEPESTESMLRCVLEGYTYLRTVDTEKLLDDFSLPSSTSVEASPFVFRGGQQWREMEEESRPYLKHLMSLLNSRPLYITSLDADKYSITEA